MRLPQEVGRGHIPFCPLVLEGDSAAASHLIRRFNTPDAACSSARGGSGPAASTVTRYLAPGLSRLGKAANPDLGRGKEPAESIPHFRLDGLAPEVPWNSEDMGTARQGQLKALLQSLSEEKLSQEAHSLAALRDEMTHPRIGDPPAFKPVVQHVSLA